MTRARSIIALPAILTAAGVTIVATHRDGSVTEEPGATRAQVLAAAVEPFAPPSGQCVDLEIVVDADDSVPDAAPRKRQSAWALCSVGPDAGVPAATRLQRACLRGARATCLAPDAGDTDDWRAALEIRCVRHAYDMCEREARRAVRVAWSSEPYAAAPGETRELRRITRGQVHGGCVCGDVHDAGPCRWIPPGSDGGLEPLPRSTVKPRALASGRGCVPSICVETNARTAPGSEIPAECKP